MWYPRSSRHEPVVTKKGMWQVDSEWIGLRGHQCVVAGRRPRVLAKQKSPRKRVSRRIERRFRGRVNIALSAISRCYNTRRSVHDNILQPSINYHQVWPIGGRRVGMWQESRDRSERAARPYPWHILPYCDDYVYLDYTYNINILEDACVLGLYILY